MTASLTIFLLRADYLNDYTAERSPTSSNNQSLPESMYSTQHSPPHLDRASGSSPPTRTFVQTVSFYTDTHLSNSHSHSPLWHRSGQKP